MLKETITYEDYNGEERTEELYFNITKTEMLDLIDLRPRLEQFGELTSGQTRDLTVAEIREMLDITKLLIEKSYGQRSEDGKHFRKSPEIFRDFQESAAFDAFVFGLFAQPEKAVAFMIGIMPQSLVEGAPELAEARQMVSDAKAQAGVETIKTVDATPPTPDVDTTEAAAPLWMREDREPTKGELMNMDKEELLAVFAWRQKREQANRTTE